MESKVDCIRGGNVWIGACAIVQRQPKRTGGSGIEERGNKERSGARITLRTGYSTMLLFRTEIEIFKNLRRIKNDTNYRIW